MRKDEENTVSPTSWQLYYLQGWGSSRTQTQRSRPLKEIDAKNIEGSVGMPDT